MRMIIARNIDEYISDFPGDIQEKLNKIRQIIKELAPGAQEAICYGIPAFKLNGNVVYFAVFKNHIGLYPAPSVAAGFKKELEPYQTSKGTIRFPLDKPLPLELIKKIVKFRVNEALSNNKEKKSEERTREIFLGF